MGVEIVVAVHVTVLAVGMILKATQNNRATRTAARRGAKGVGESGAFLGKLVQIRSLNDRISVTACVQPLIVDHKHDHVLWGAVDSN